MAVEGPRFTAIRVTPAATRTAAMIRIDVARNRGQLGFVDRRLGCARGVHHLVRGLHCPLSL